ncbi:hypothetical protein M9H77_21230 [Catharanthus roseus]|uniref:Uncharacterized protein n=1 Tax=Catharanthus roseus TaxID=4058 RepID=A0ACC0APH7_CATRO|nr:hypothetical protein M9H77_21230 [Catharanthus roseus]
MEEVPADVHPGPIVTDVLSRQHEHRSGLIWSGDWETCYTDLQCRRFGRNLFQCYSAAPRRLLSLSYFSDYKVKKEPLEAWILRAFTGSETDDDLILRARGFIFLLIGRHMLSDFPGNLVHAAVHPSFGGCTTDWRGFGVSSYMSVVAYTYIAASADDGDYGRPSCSSWRNMFMWLPYYDCPLVPSDLWRAEVSLICYEIVEYHYPGHVMRQFAQAQMVPNRVRDGPTVEYVDALSYPSDEYIRWYKGITRVYIGNPANRDTRAYGYQPPSVDRRMMEVDDMASVAIREPPSSPSQIAAVMKKVQTIIRRCMVSIGFAYATFEQISTRPLKIQP